MSKNFFLILFLIISLASLGNPLNRDEVNGFDRKATFNYSPSASQESDITLALLMGSTLIDKEVDKKNLLISGGIALGLTELVKQTAKRPRPYVYNEDVPIEIRESSDSRKSFFSGHTTLAFYSAAVLSKGAPIWVQLATYGLATRTGYLRYKAGKHYPSDILVGALVGYAIGRLSNTQKEGVKLTPLGISFGFSF